MSTIFVSGSWQERESLIIPMMDRLRALGFGISFDWTHGDRSGLHDSDLPVAVQASYARSDMRGVQDADYYWLILPTTPSKGSYVELGIALATYDGPRVVVSGGGSTIFAALADDRFDFHEDALAFFERVGPR